MRGAGVCWAGLSRRSNAIRRPPAPMAVRPNCSPPMPISGRSAARRSPRPAVGRSRRKPNEPSPPRFESTPGSLARSSILALPRCRKGIGKMRSCGGGRWKPPRRKAPNGCRCCAVGLRASRPVPLTAHRPGRSRRRARRARTSPRHSRCRRRSGRGRSVPWSRDSPPRLEEEPDDAEGWARLARSWRVLGEREKERDALAALARLLPEGSPRRVDVERHIEALDREK